MGIVDSLLDIGSKILDRVIPDSNARALAKEELNRAVLEEGFQIDLAQLNINNTEAQSDNIFKS